ncbi:MULTISPECIES: GntR family transcriptional regulator [unclassified Xanthobacter]|uniref:GntR family transcriptional regulator n=1 Tax=unclassified Xanthobacter TaxID=2623496 RepID=UPI001EDD7EA7|nr:MULTISPECIES: FCD domain-containing protein [unclassified Xanthobacter]
MKSTKTKVASTTAPSGRRQTSRADIPAAPSAPAPRVEKGGGATTGSGKTTLALSAYSRLREDILNVTLQPNAKLRIRELCERYEVGLSPMREALSRLASEGLVVQTAQRGFTVASFSVQELIELVRTKKWLNEIGVRESIIHGDAAWEEGVLLAFHRLAKTPRFLDGESDDGSGRNADWNTAHLAFHTSLIDACRSEWLKSFCRTLFTASERYRAVARMKSEPTKRLDEHRQIMEAAVSRDGDLAVRLLNTHFDNTVTLVLASLERLGESAEPEAKRRGRKARGVGASAQ